MNACVSRLPHPARHGPGSTQGNRAVGDDAGGLLHVSRTVVPTMPARPPVRPAPPQRPTPRDPATCEDARRRVSARKPGVHIIPSLTQPGDVDFEVVAYDGRLLGEGRLAEVLASDEAVDMMALASEAASNRMAAMCAACGRCPFGAVPIKPGVARGKLRLEA